MKLQLEGQRVRMRIDEAELERLLGGDMIVNAIELAAGGRFRQTLRLHDDIQPSLQAGPDEWRARLPEARVREYLHRLPCREALAFELAGAGDAPVLLELQVDVRDSLRVRGPRVRP